MDPLEALVLRTLGPGTVIEDCSRAFGRRSRTWRVFAGCTTAYAKQHESRKLYEAESRAYRELVPRLGSAPWFAVPQVLADDDTLGALVLTAVPGRDAESATWRAGERAQIHELAGRFAARLHALPVDTSGLPPAGESMAARLRPWLDAARPHLPGEDLRFAEGEWSKLAGSALRYASTHSDYSPRNWTRADEGGVPVLGVFDWERARPEPFGVDMQRIVHAWWHDDPSLADAFWRGYGRVPDPDEWATIHRLALLHAVGGIPWAVERGDTGFEATNRRIIARARASLAAL